MFYVVEPSKGFLATGDLLCSVMFSIISFLVYHLSLSSLMSMRLIVVFGVYWCCYCNILFKMFILRPPSASSCASWAAVDLAVLTVDLTVESELLRVLMPLSIRSCIFLGTSISSSSSIYFWRILAFRGSTEWANLKRLSFFFWKMWGLII